MTKTEKINMIVKNTGMKKKDVITILDQYRDISLRELKKTKATDLLGLAKMRVIRKKRVPVRKNWTSPFTGEVKDLPAKPAHNKVKVRALKRATSLVS